MYDVNFFMDSYSLQCIITDARHDSSRAAMHSTVSAISMRWGYDNLLLIIERKTTFTSLYLLLRTNIVLMFLVLATKRSLLSVIGVVKMREVHLAGRCPWQRKWSPILLKTMVSYIIICLVWLTLRVRYLEINDFYSAVSITNRS